MRKRKWIFFLIVHFLILIHILLWYTYDWQVIGAVEFADFFRMLLENKTLTIGAIFTIAMLFVSLIWGRLFCGWACHIGLVYDLLEPLTKKVRPSWAAIHPRLGLLACFAMLIGYFMVPSFREAPDVSPALTTDLAATSPLELFPVWQSALATLIIVLFCLPLLLGERAFCRMLCPWGALLSIPHRFSRNKIRKVGSCTQCGLCSTNCPMDIDVSHAINTEFSVFSLSCVQCHQCVAVCPETALALTDSKAILKEPLPSNPPDGFYLKWYEEVLFWAAVLTIGLVYDEIYAIGHFLSFSLGLLGGWICVQLWRAIRVKKRRLLFAILFVLCSLIVFKDGQAHYHFDKGRALFVERNYAEALPHYERAEQGFWKSPTILWLHLYVIYKDQGNQEKQDQIRAKYEARQRAQKS